MMEMAAILRLLATPTGICKYLLFVKIICFSLNINKRISRNDFEHLVTVVPLSLVNGLIYPMTTTGLMLTYFIGRQLYTQGYLEKDGAFD